MKKEQQQEESQEKLQPTTGKKDYKLLEEKLKKQFGDITKIVFTVKKEILVAYLREPNLAELDATLSTLQSAPVSSSVGMFRTCFVGGDDELLELAGKIGFSIAINREIQKIIPNISATSTNI
ncbi:MAG TPA: hypothetical protein VK658_08795 [Chryseolinea sp.]|nr:hypothetical protein [Chryseolinea sp.]